MILPAKHLTKLGKRVDYILSLKYDSSICTPKRNPNMPHKQLLPEGWPQPRGYANGVAASGTEIIFLGGQIGWDINGNFPSNEFLGQLTQTLENVKAVLNAAQLSPEDMTRMTWYLTDKAAYTKNLPEIGKVYRDIMGRNFPAMSVVEVSALVEDEALVEIEVTAVK